MRHYLFLCQWTKKSEKLSQAEIVTIYEEYFCINLEEKLGLVEK